MLDCGRVDDHDAGLGGGLDVDVVQADAGAGDDLEPAGRRRCASASTLVALRTRMASTSAIAGQQRGAVGAVAVADLEVGAEGVDGGGRELFGDEDDGLGHGAQPPNGAAPGTRTSLAASVLWERAVRGRAALTCYSSVGRSSSSAGAARGR